MRNQRIYELITRLSRLLQAEERAGDDGLQPVQLHALHYLDRCNRYSDRPQAVADFLGVTKGTASQTLQVLEQRELITKTTDPEDRRSVRLALTSRGRRLVRASPPALLLEEALNQLAPKEREGLAGGLESLLLSLQRANGDRSFGVCHTCRHFQKISPHRYRCGLTSEPLTRADTDLICREHETA